LTTMTIIVFRHLQAIRRSEHPHHGNL
jgi:hypothetical protein